MAYNASLQDLSVANGGAGTPEVWDIISLASPHNFAISGKIVMAFMCLDDTAGTFSAMEEDNPMTKLDKIVAGKAVAAKYLTHSFSHGDIYEGRYTKLTPAGASTFKVWFLK